VRQLVAHGEGRRDNTAHDLGVDQKGTANERLSAIPTQSHQASKPVSPESRLCFRCYWRSGWS
jgi:hypothetical protein